MFTPPPSPQPKLRGTSPSTNAPIQHACSSLPSPNEAKHTGRRIKWTVLLVPLVVILVTASTRYLVHPVAFDIFSEPPVALSWDTMLSKGSDWRPHKRHPEPQQATSSAPTSTPSPVPATASVTENLPTIPSNTPILPTPFPQPLDSSWAQNFSSVSCSNFFNNMTNTPPFRSCRPFSMLLQTSTAFIKMQQNLTLLNAVIWGTCNTTLEKDQCVENMASFSSALKTACAQDLADQNPLAVDTLISLQAYGLMRDTACIADPATNTYCYVNAANNPNPSDLYFYSLPLGTGMPQTSTPSCTPCTRSVLHVYAAALENATQADQLSGLQGTYDASAELAVQQCGTDYAQTAIANGGLISLGGGVPTWFAITAVIMGWSLLLVSP